MTSLRCARPPRSAPSPRTVRETSPRRSAIRKTVLMASLTSRPRACHRLSLLASPLAMGSVSCSLGSGMHHVLPDQSFWRIGVTLQPV